jgi:CheY-like chemotaxis protein/HPt (histidine-containing phosphotransfer) domain-containing protein
LVADDSDINLFVAKRILQKEGAHVTQARNGQEAVEHLRALDARPDVVLMDAHMPVLDGFGATEVIRRELGITLLPIIALTADARPTERQRAFAVGMNDFLAKPFDPKDLIRSIQRLVTPSAPPPAATGSAKEAGGAGQWCRIEGIDVDKARGLLAGDWDLFRELLLHLVEEYRDVSPPGSLEDPPTRVAYTARMHKLKGAAGQLGAREISALAGRIETGCAKSETEGTLELAGQLSQQLARLRATVQATFESEPALQPAPVSAPPAPPQLDAIVYLLREQNLAVLEQVRALYPWARATWGPARYDSFVGHVQSLRFAEAAAMLEPHLRSSA